MTREEAKTNLDIIRVAFGVPVTKEQKELVDETFEMAIQALSQEPCDDAISRDAVKEIICAEFVDTQDGMQEWRNAVNDVVENILHKVEQLPSVTQKSGEWLTDEIIHADGYKYTVTYCSECDEQVDYRTDYCPNCGAKMKSEDKK